MNHIDLAMQLRVGNWLVNNKMDYPVYFEVDAEGIDSIYNGWSVAEPIPLTTEILIKAGFVKYKVGSEYYENWIGPNNIYISKCIKSTERGFNDVVGNYYMGEYHTHIPNLHWLQNLVYFNYKFELEIKL